MDYFPRYAKLPEGRRFHDEAAAAAARLQTQLRRLDASALGLSDYIRHSIRRYVERMPYALEKDAFVFLLGVAGVKGELSSTVLVDYGGGAGTLSLLARQAGVGTVIYSDIYQVSCHDARQVARALGLEADHYVEGGLDELAGYLGGRGISCDVLVSVNVIEHVYDVDHFLAGLGGLADGPLTVALSSTANPRNPARLLQLARTQRRAEHRDREAGPGHKERDATEAFLSVRRRMIRALLERACAVLPDDEEELLARRTRGMAEEDIARAVAEYLASGEPPAAPRHWTNTCDPYTGNWAEHLMDLNALAQALGEAGFEAEVVCGYYASPQPALRLLAGPLNLSIRMLGDRWGLLAAPSFVLLGMR